MSQPAMVCGRGPTVEGIDVSEYQTTVNWAMVRASGRRFAIARVAHLPRIDPTFARNWAGIRAAGMIRGAYLYFDPNQDAARQADIVVNAVGRLGPGDLPVTLDVEFPSPNIPAPTVYASRIRTFVERVTAGTGRAPMIYTGYYYWGPYVRTREFNSLPLWHAQYTSARCPTIADAWGEWAFWQYSSTGRVAGIVGNVDLDRFNGSFEDLQRLAGIGPMDAGVERDAAVRDAPREVAVRDAPRAEVSSPDVGLPDVVSSLDARAGDVADVVNVVDVVDVTATETGVDAADVTETSPDAGTDDVREDRDAAPGEDGGEAAPDAPAPDGCGCRSAASRPAAGGWIALLALVSGCARRRSPGRRGGRRRRNFAALRTSDT